jgi:hypothetical protein
MENPVIQRLDLTDNQSGLGFPVSCEDFVVVKRSQDIVDIPDGKAGSEPGRDLQAEPGPKGLFLFRPAGMDQQKAKAQDKEKPHL